MNGVNLKPESLHPPVIYPVARGTPMIAPSLLWDDKIKWDVPKPLQGSRSGGDKTVHYLHVFHDIENGFILL